ncbi:Recombination protein RecR [Olavius algarvensis associated proteobacterium Delta 3]|nr:Recombination protein RecR [Olavius algarvensis associated proteobacterium Delta 3]CAB5152907.1 Recombination protein RecR [Olavius algarvensis associated proteobacterium Delta 3]
MNYYPESIRNLIKNLSKLPGIGEKTAERLAMHILRSPRRQAEALARSIHDVKQNIRLCRSCFALSDRDVCNICGDPNRDATVLCVVEQAGDMISIERSGAFRGCYHVLSGVLSPMDGVGPEDIRVHELIRRAASGKIREVLLATGTSVEGEATAAYLQEQLTPLPVTVTRIASGVPVGGDLKYVDQVTLKRAIESRRKV